MLADRERAIQILSPVGLDKAFYFYLSENEYTGVYADSFKQFIDRLKRVRVSSVEFHFHREDFRKWFSDVLGDIAMAEEISSLSVKGLEGESLRQAILEILERRFSKLVNISSVGR